MPSHLLAVAGALATSGAVALPLMVLCAWIEPAWLVPIAFAAMLGGALPGLRIYRDTMSDGGFEALISHDGSVEILGSEAGETRGKTRTPPRGQYRLTAGSIAWPDLSVLALEPNDLHDPGVASRGVVRIAVLRRDLDPEDARRLHRFMLWSLRGGAPAASRREVDGWQAST